MLLFSGVVVVEKAVNMKNNDERLRMRGERGRERENGSVSIMLFDRANDDSKLQC